MRTILRLVLVAVAFTSTMVLLVRMSDDLDYGDSARSPRISRVYRHVANDIEIQLQNAGAVDGTNSSKLKLQYVKQV